MRTVIRFIAAAAVLWLLLLHHVSANTSVSSAKIFIDPRDLLLNKDGVKLTLAFTPATQLSPGGSVNIQYSAPFFFNGVTPSVVSCSVPSLSGTVSTTSASGLISITTSGAAMSPGGGVTITIGGLKIGSTSATSNFRVFTSADQGLVNTDGYTSGTKVAQFSMTIANSDRTFAKAATVTISFTPSNEIPTTNGRITLFFPANMFKDNPCTSNCPFTYKTSISNAYLSTQTGYRCQGRLCFHEISNGAQLSPPTGSLITANSPFTITISGLVLGSPVGNTPESVFVSTSRDTAGSDAVDTGYIGLGSYTNGSCPFGMTWSNEHKACTSCSASPSSTGLLCDDFSECVSCTTCPDGQSLSQNSNKPPAILGPPPAMVHYACSNSSTLCPPGSGKLFGDNGGCSPCPFDKYNDGSSGSCQNCPSGTYPFYSMMRTSVRVNCPYNVMTRSGTRCDEGSVQTGWALKKSASSCSSKCPPGTAVLSEIPIVEFPWGTRIMTLSGLQSGVGIPPFFSFLLGDFDLSDAQKDKGCLPCSLWFISKDNSCQACNEGATDRDSLNTMGNTFTYASHCVPNICPWPYVAPGKLIMQNQVFNRKYIAVPSNPYDASPTSSKDTHMNLCKFNVHLGGTVATITVIAVVLFSIYTVSIAFAGMGQDEDLTDTRRRKLVVGMLLITVSPAIDFVSDLMYIVSTLFYNDIICIVACFFYILPMFFFWRMLARHGVSFGFYIGKPPAFAVMEKYDNIPKALLGLAGYIPLYIINLPMALPLFLVGHVLYCCKVFPISRVSNLWLRLYTRTNKHTSSVVIIIPLLQESIFEEMMTESVPQMIIQIFNNSLTNVWSPLSYFSTAMSGIMVLNGIWRLVYYRLYLKIRIGNIPTDLSKDLFNFKSVEKGENPLGESTDNKVAPELELSTILSAVAESDEFSPLIQRHVTASAEVLRAEMQVLKSEMSAEIQEINQRSLRMEASLQELISRTGTSS